MKSVITQGDKKGEAPSIQETFARQPKVIKLNPTFEVLERILNHSPMGLGAIMENCLISKAPDGVQDGLNEKIRYPI